MIYHIYANRSNIGDWLSAKGIQKLLSPLKITECLCDGPFVKETMNILSGASEKDIVVIGGGGLIMDYFIPFWEAFQSIADRVPFCIWGIGCCDLKNEATLPSPKLIEEIVNRSKLCIVRDELTRSFLKACNLPSSVSCPSINIVDPYAEKGRGLLHVANYTTAGADTHEAMGAAGHAFAEDTGRIYRETDNRIAKGSEKEMARVLLRYEKSEFVLSSALHGCIISLAMGLKVLAVSGDRKIDGFMEAVGLQDWVLDVREVHRVPQRLKELHSQPEPASILEDIRKKNEDIALQIKQIATSAYSDGLSIRRIKKHFHGTSI